MAVVINTNVDSIRVQHNLKSASDKMSTSMQRMSSGLKVLTAKDDAAGTVIAARMQVQLDGNQICQNNVQNGNAMLSTMEGNLDVVEDNLVRIRDLALQAKNGTYSKEEISAMQDEVSQRILELDRISSSSKYSQLSLFEDEDLQKNGVTFQVGANSSDDNTIVVDKSLFDSVQFEKLTGRDGTTINYGEKFDKDDMGEYAYVQGTELVAGVKGVVDLYKYDTGNDKPGTEAKPALKVKKSDIDGGKIKYDTNGDGVLEDITVTTLIDSTTADDVYQIGHKADGLDLTTLNPQGFVYAIDDLDKAIDNITARKSIIGSAGNRLDSALDTLETQYENLSSAKSIITDDDIASEASTYTQQQILQQVATSLLAQANQAPGIALSLI